MRQLRDRRHALPEEQAAIAQRRVAQRDRERLGERVDRRDLEPARGRRRGRSSRSASLSRGITMCVIPARTAPRIFSLSPPIGSTRPDSVISPVIATSWRAGRPDSADTIAVAIAMPADGPSFGIAPAGTCTWTSRSNTRSSIAEPVGVRPRVRPRGARRLLHHVAELAGEDQVALARASAPPRRT